MKETEIIEKANYTTETAYKHKKVNGRKRIEEKTDRIWFLVSVLNTYISKMNYIFNVEEPFPIQESEFDKWDEDDFSFIENHMRKLINITSFLEKIWRNADALHSSYKNYDKKEKE